MTFCYEDFAFWFSFGATLTFLSLLPLYWICRQENLILTSLESTRSDLREALEGLPTGIRDEFTRDSIESNVELLQKEFSHRGGEDSETVRDYLQRLTMRHDDSSRHGAEILNEVRRLRGNFDTVTNNFGNIFGSLTTSIDNLTTTINDLTNQNLEVVNLLRVLTTEVVKIQRESSQPPSPTGDGSR